MHIAIVGTGYVGLVSGACFADFGFQVTCVDVDAERIRSLERGDVPFYEPGLPELVARNTSAGRLGFTTNLPSAVRDATVVFLAVGTPEGPDGDADISQLAAAAVDVARCLDGYRVIATKSTVPVGTGAWLDGHIRAHVLQPADFDVVSNPEFLREGSAVHDFLRPDRVVIGANTDRAREIMREVYRPLYLIETPIVLTNLETAELIKYASNAYLAVKVSFINEMANLCDRAGADVHVVAKAMGLDKRIGPKFLHAGPGFGGSCFPKDTRALAASGRRAGTPQRLVESAIEINDRQRDMAYGKIVEALGGAKGRRVAILGLAFKPNTSDVREAPAIELCRRLVDAGAHVSAYDPVASDEATLALGGHAGRVTLQPDAQAALKDADCAVIVTEWNEFRSLDLAEARDLMARPVLVDLRNLHDPAQAVELGFEYYCTGRQSLAGSRIEPKRATPTG